MASATQVTNTYMQEKKRNSFKGLLLVKTKIKYITY